MSEIYHRYQSGERLTNLEVNTPQGLDLYGEIGHFEWRREKMTKQGTYLDFGVLAPDVEFTLNFGTYFQKVHPVEPQLTPEQAHLQRQPDTREGRRIQEIQAELQTMI